MHGRSPWQKCNNSAIQARQTRSVSHDITTDLFSSPTVDVFGIEILDLEETLEALSDVRENVRLSKPYQGQEVAEQDHREHRHAPIRVLRTIGAINGLGQEQRERTEHIRQQP